MQFVALAPDDLHLAAFKRQVIVKEIAAEDKLVDDVDGMVLDGVLADVQAQAGVRGGSAVVQPQLCARDRGEHKVRHADFLVIGVHVAALDGGHVRAALYEAR